MWKLVTFFQDEPPEEKIRKFEQKYDKVRPKFFFCRVLVTVEMNLRFCWVLGTSDMNL